MKTIAKTLLLFLSIIHISCMGPREIAGPQMVEQSELVGRISFPNRIKNPIKVEVESKGDKYVFSSINNSFLPYQLEVEFTQIVNLDPTIKYYRSIIDPGRSRLFELQARPKTSDTNYNYKIRYMIGNPDLSPDKDFPYLIPLSENKNTATNIINSGIEGFSPALFSVAEGDTIYSMRKGNVTAIPDGNAEVDRLTPMSLEVYHHDGTLGSYYGKYMIALVRPGDYVYPGQPIGVMKQQAKISINVYQFSSNYFGPIPIKYTVDGTTLLTLKQINGVAALHPTEVIQKELSESELKKHQNGNLYK